MIDFEKLRDALIKECSKRGFEHVAEDIGLHRNTVYGIIKGKNTNPRLSTLLILEELYNGQHQ